MTAPGLAVAVDVRDSRERIVHAHAVEAMRHLSRIGSLYDREQYERADVELRAAYERLRWIGEAIDAAHEVNHGE